MKQNLLNESINNAILKLIKSGDSSIKRLTEKHENKIHIIPIEYRIFGGMLQSLNIKFGNFIEILMHQIIENENRYEIIKEYSGKKNVAMNIDKQVRQSIDDFIANNMVKDFSDEELKTNFQFLLNNIVECRRKSKDFVKEKNNDVDILFKNKEKNIHYYVEVKYNDDHDTGKFENISSKFLKTYAGLVSILNIDDSKNLVPILFYFNNLKKIGNIHIPSDFIYRGERFFKDFLTTDYNELDVCIKNVSEKKEIKKIFDDFYQKIVKNKEFINTEKIFQSWDDDIQKNGHVVIKYGEWQEVGEGFKSWGEKKQKVRIVSQVNAGKALHIAEEDLLGYIFFNDFADVDTKKDFALQIDGDSMNEKRINDKLIEEDDYVLVKPDYSINSGDTIVAIDMDGAVNVKEFYKDEDGGMLKSISNNKENINVDSTGYTKLGKVVDVIKSKN